jgi:hypothetical protein
VGSGIGFNSIGSRTVKTVTFEQVFNAETSLEDLKGACADRLKFGALDCRIEKRDTGEFALVTVQPGPEMLMAHAGLAPEAVAKEEAVAAFRAADASLPLGVLSGKYESNGNPAAVGDDSTGGPSYGKYQIATKTGTMASFLEFLARTRPEFADHLDAAGGNAAAAAKSPEFVAAWQQLARDADFAAAQHAFIKSTHYDPFVEKTKDHLALDIESRSDALKNVAWSTAVQHGPGCKVFINALAGQQASAMPDANVIRAVYTERARVDRYFSRSTPEVKQALMRRFDDECSEALALI